MLYPEFRLWKAKPGTVPDGVTYAGTIVTPDGEAYGVHARVVETDGHKEFVGGLFRIEMLRANEQDSVGVDANGSPVEEYP